MIRDYQKLALEREEMGIPPLPLNKEQTKNLTELLEKPQQESADELLYLLTERVPPGVDESAYVKATWLV